MATDIGAQNPSTWNNRRKILCGDAKYSQHNYYNFSLQYKSTRTEQKAQDD
jgi:hypothetical protein